MAHFLKSMARVAVHYLLGGRKVWVFAGLRRSGNHAIIAWIINGLEGRPTPYDAIDAVCWFTSSDSGETIFLNEVNRVPGTSYLEELWKRRKLLRRARNIILSYEDSPVGCFSHWKTPLYIRQRIFIHRSLLNIIASRLEKLRRAAQDGQRLPMMGIDESMLDALLSLSTAPPSLCKTIKFDQWVDDPAYRQALAEELGLHGDILPGISKEGGGSSFSGQRYVPSASELSSRFKACQFPDRIIAHLRDPKYAALTTSDEKQFLNVQAGLHGGLLPVTCRDSSDHSSLENGLRCSGIAAG